MPCRTVDLTPEQDAVVADAVARRRYRDPDEVVRDAMAMLQRRWSAGDEPEVALRREIMLGLASLDRGDFTDVVDDDLDRYLDDLATRPVA